MRFLKYLAIIPIIAADPLSSRPRRVAIVGAGIGGSATAEFLHRLMGDDVEIDVFEKEDHAGGRLGLLEINGKTYDSGGAVIHPRNQYMVNFTDLLDLERVEDGGTDRLYLFDPDARKWDLRQTGWQIWDMIQLFWRYGFSLFRLEAATEKMLGKFDRIYDYQDQGRTYSTVEELIGAMGGKEFVRMLKRPLPDHLKSKGIKEPLISELAGAAMAVNYGQMLEYMPAFVGMVSLAGMQPGLFRIKSGNGRICETLIKHAGARLLLSRSVTSITRRNCDALENLDQDTPRYLITYDGPLGQESQDYDGVVLAAPLQLAKIQLNGFPNIVNGGEGEYQRTVSTFVHGTELNPAFFGGGFKAEDSPESVLAIRPGNGFTSVSTQQDVDSPGNSTDNSVWKVFSRLPIDTEQVGELFEDPKDKKARDWLAYPKYKGFSTRDITPLSLDGDAAAYTSPIEWAASAMEMSCVGAANAALLVHQALVPGSQGKCLLRSEGPDGEEK